MKKKLPFIVAAILVTIFIFSNSLQNAARSTEQSDVIVDAVVEAAQALGVAVKRSGVEHIVRKCAHILEFAAQGFFVTLCFDCELKKRLKFVLAAGLLTACTDECIQLFSNGRAAMVQDIFIDLAGVFAGFLVVWALEIRRRKDVCR